jgi:hypothetical protein
MSCVSISKKHPTHPSFARHWFTKAASHASWLSDDDRYRADADAAAAPARTGGCGPLRDKIRGPGPAAAADDDDDGKNRSRTGLCSTSLEETQKQET